MNYASCSSFALTLTLIIVQTNGTVHKRTVKDENFRDRYFNVCPAALI